MLTVLRILSLFIGLIRYWICLCIRGQLMANTLLRVESCALTAINFITVIRTILVTVTNLVS